MYKHRTRNACTCACRCSPNTHIPLLASFHFLSSLKNTNKKNYKQSCTLKETLGCYSVFRLVICFIWKLSKAFPPTAACVICSSEKPILFISEELVVQFNIICRFSQFTYRNLVQLNSCIIEILFKIL